MAVLASVLVLGRSSHPPAKRNDTARVITPIDHASETSNVEYLADAIRAEGPGAAHAAGALARIHDEKAAPALAALARDEHGSVLLRANAVHALGASGGDPVLLVELATDARQPMRVRQEAALALRTRGTAESVASLATALEREPEEQMRISLIQALKAINSVEAQAAVAQHAQRQLSATERAFVEAKT
jgi:HEAT repeat protein